MRETWAVVEKVHSYVVLRFPTKLDAEDHVDAQPEHLRWRLVVRREAP